MYAMKYMNKTACAQQEAVSNVIREVQILKAVEHVFIVNLWYCFQDEEDMFMVVDLLLGGDLRYHMAEDMNFTEDHVTLYMAELALALDYLRGRGIIHRDIKPDNILLDEEGHVHITDFNIAAETGKDGTASSLSGTKPYMAPEIFSTALGERDGYSFAVDWWALGVTIFELLKKRRPFIIHGDTGPQETIHVLVNTNIHFPSSASDNMNDLLRQLLLVDAKQRIQTLAAVRSHPAMAAVNLENVKAKKIKPLFVPSNDQLNCDPTYELEEMIIETKPLHKKKKRLAKQLSKKDSLSSDNASTTKEKPDMFKDFPYYNRESDLSGKKSPPPSAENKSSSVSIQRTQSDVKRSDVVEFPAQSKTNKQSLPDSCNELSKHDNVIKTS
ncbi:hypothetical protein RRG08_047263 [Elysia crispata]|uniref:Protein kinase domain-containing protein n=1 Tax=Elysia crispata TaxID=231223 RepID=A0AAE1A324_9GAST|nr:hypothetical protein RRG08_047263 [Elysia crispata]